MENKFKFDGNRILQNYLFNYSATFRDCNRASAPSGSTKKSNQSPFSWTQQFWHPQFSLTLGTNIGKWYIRGNTSFLIRCMGNLWSDKRNVDPVSCRLLIYILCKDFTSIFIQINTKDCRRLKQESLRRADLKSILYFFP